MHVHTEFNPAVLDATLQMQVEATNAAFGIYWKQECGKYARLAKSYVSSAYEAELKAAGRESSFVEVSLQSEIEIAGPSPAALAIRTRSKVCQLWFASELCLPSC